MFHCTFPPPPPPSIFHFDVIFLLICVMGAIQEKSAAPDFSLFLEQQFLNVQNCTNLSVSPKQSFMSKLFKAVAPFYLNKKCKGIICLLIVKKKKYTCFNFWSKNTNFMLSTDFSFWQDFEHPHWLAQIYKYTYTKHLLGSENMQRKRTWSHGQLVP